MVSTTVFYVALMLGSVPFTLAALYKVLDSTRRRGARPLAALLVGTLVWTLSALTVELAPTFTVGLYANRIQYLGIVLVPTAFLVFALMYVDREHLVNRYSLGALSLEPLAVLALVWTNPTHGLWTQGIVPEGGTYVADGTQATCRAVICFGDSGAAFLAHTLYSYVVLLAGAALVLWRPLRSSEVPRGQGVSMAVAVLAPLVANAASLFVLPSGFPDLTPVAFGVSGVALVVGLYRYSLVETSALSAAAAVDDRETAAVLVSDDDEVVDLNVAAATVLGVDADTAVGADAGDAFETHEALRAAHGRDHGTASGTEVADPISGERYEVDVAPVDPDGANTAGRLYEFHAME